MLAEAEAQVDNSNQILNFTRRIKDHFDEKGPGKRSSSFCGK